MEINDWKEQLAAKFGITEPRDDTPASHLDDKPADTLPPRDGRIDIILDRKGRHGKTATIIVPSQGTDAEIAELAKQLRQQCGTGGSARGGEILLQGDCRNRAAEILNRLGYKTRLI